MKVQLLSIVGALALTTTAAAGPAAAASASTPGQLGTSAPAQLSPMDSPWGPGAWDGAAWNNSLAPGWGGYLAQTTTGGTSSSSSSGSSDSSSASSSGSMSDNNGHEWHSRRWGSSGQGMGMGMGMPMGGPTGSPWPWWAGMPLSQISLATGGAWPMAFGPPLFIPPPVPPVPPIGFGAFGAGFGQFNGGFGNNNIARLSAQAIIPGRLSAQAIGGGVFGINGGFNVNGGVNGFGFR